MKVEDLIQEEKNSDAVAFLRFALLTSKGIDSYFCFVEGYDSPYYEPKISGLTSFQVYPIVCGNKKNVLRVCELIKNIHLYNNYKKGFFVDKDYDIDNDKYSNKGIYVTPCYSVENLYANFSVLTRILRCEFNLTEVDSSFTKLKELYEYEFSAFINATKLFNSWYACIKSLPTENKINLDNSFPETFATIEITRINSNYTYEDIKIKYPDASEIENSELNRMETLLCENYEMNCRGKYTLEFFYKFLKHLIDDANNTSSRNYFRKKTKFSLSKAIMISQISQYSLFPNCLRDYIINSLN